MLIDYIIGIDRTRGATDILQDVSIKLGIRCKLLNRFHSMRYFFVNSTSITFTTVFFKFHNNKRTKIV